METNIANNIALLEAYHSDIILTEYSCWSNKLKENAFCAPVFTQEILSEQLHSCLLFNTAYRNLFSEKKREKKLDFFYVPTQSIRCFPKLGVMSWKEVPEMTTISKGTPSELFLRMLFSSITIRMASVLHTWVEEKVSTNFYLYPYIDLSNSIELRFLVSKNETKFIEKTAIGNKINMEMKAVIAFVNELKNEIALEQSYVDIIITGNEMKLLEINPVVGRIHGR